tara:strand:- start:54 stop:596 length:543 start_codon:yes stop_codon:yes gene_type:complete
MIKYNITKIIFLNFVLYFCFYCTPAPRYKSDSIDKTHSSSKVHNKSTSKNKISPKKSKKNKSNTKTYNPKKTIYKGMSSFYGPKFHGKLTANGEIFDMYGVTAAHKEFPFNTITRVTNENNGKSLIIRINDRGPYIDGRILDCSFGAAKKLGFVSEGVAPVKIEIMEWGDGEYMHHNYND